MYRLKAFRSPALTDNFRASLLMVLTMAGFATEDMFIKLAAERVPVGEILLLLGIGGTAIMLAIARVQRTDLLAPELLCAPMLIRSGSEMLAMMFGMSALALLPLSLVTAIGQAGPIVTTLGAAVFLAEPVGWRRWSAVAVGLAGVLLILRPGSATFEPAMILSALAITFVAARDLATRRAPAVLSIMQLNFWGYLMTLPTGLLLMAINGKAPVMPEPRDWAFIAAALALGVVFYFTLIAGAADGRKLGRGAVPLHPADLRAGAGRHGLRRAAGCADAGRHRAGHPVGALHAAARGPDAPPPGGAAFPCIRSRPV